jgi:F0F1-type ATP synthase membrane subunit b/b'
MTLMERAKQEHEKEQEEHRKKQEEERASNIAYSKNQMVENLKRVRL